MGNDELTLFEKIVAVATLMVSFVAAIIGGTLVAFLDRYFKQQDRNSESDAKVFAKSDEILSEKKIINITFQLIESHSISHENSSRLNEWREFIKRDENKHLNSAVNKKTKKLLSNLIELTKFISDNFDFWKNIEGPLYLKPELDPDKAINEDDVTQEQVDKYHSYTRELNRLATNLKRYYSEYRITVKNKLKI